MLKKQKKVWRPLVERIFCRLDLLVGCRLCCSPWGSFNGSTTEQLPTGVKETLLIPLVKPLADLEMPGLSSNALL